MHFVRNPEYGKDYDDGYVFFSYNTTSFISAGIALFSRKEALNGVPISHCGIVTGERECIEAASPGGIQRSDFVSKYIEPQEIMVFLCKPRNLTPAKAALMRWEAESHLGKGYATTGVAGSALWNIFGLTWIPWFRRRRNWLNSKKRMFCSELCAESLIKGFPDRPGCLQWHPTNIYPSTLFNDHEVFHQWKSSQARQRKQEGRIVVPAVKVIH
jgi:hypothetical protein